MLPSKIDHNSLNFESSELILNPDGSIYHLGIKGEDIEDIVIVVGDQNRVQKISSRFSEVRCKIENREFVCHSGFYKGKGITVLSTGIGTDNIDIVLNELDAAVNLNLTTKKPNGVFRKLSIVRIGTSGALQPEIATGSFLLSEYVLGLDGLLQYYENPLSEADEISLENTFIKETNWDKNLPKPYAVKGSSVLFNALKDECIAGITATAVGFYAPQGRSIRLPLRNKAQNTSLTNFNWNGRKITNYEMETSALYGLGSMLGHDVITVCAIIANRTRGEFSADPKKDVEQLIDVVLDKLSAL
ncbi:MAG: nucleoside phosphorylase [Luteibaculaceae bacterium]